MQPVGVGQDRGEVVTRAGLRLGTNAFVWGWGRGEKPADLGMRGNAPSLRRAPRITSLPLAVVVVNLAFLSGWINVLRGRRIDAWHRTDWAAVDESAGGGRTGR